MNYKILGTFKLVDCYWTNLETRHADNLLFARVNVGLHDTMVLDEMEAHHDFIDALLMAGDVQPVKLCAGVRVEIAGVVS